MRVTVTGATGLIGERLVRALRERGDDVTVLSRDPERARGKLAGATAGGNAAAGGAGALDAAAWDPTGGPAPEQALAGRDGVIHLAGEPVAQRWTPSARQRIGASRETGTANLVAGLRMADPRPRVLVSASAVGYYGPRGDEQVDEQTPPGDDFLAQVCVAWEREAQAAEALGLRVVRLRTGVVLDPAGGALAKMLPPFKRGVGGPVAGGRQYLPWIHLADLGGLYRAALDGGAAAGAAEPGGAAAPGGDDWSGAVNATAPDPPTNADFSKALGRALHRPAVLPVPGFALKLLYGEMEQIVTTGQRAVPQRAQALGYAYRHPQLDEALRAALGD